MITPVYIRRTGKCPFCYSLIVYSGREDWWEHAWPIIGVDPKGISHDDRALLTKCGLV